MAGNDRRISRRWLEISSCGEALSDVEPVNYPVLRAFKRYTTEYTGCVVSTQLETFSAEEISYAVDKPLSHKGVLKHQARQSVDYVRIFCATELFDNICPVRYKPDGNIYNTLYSNSLRDI